VKMIPGVSYEKIDDEGLHVTIGGERQLLAVDHVIQLRRHVAAADQMHRFPCRAQRFRQLAARLLTGADKK
jgi:hypothetical protein